MYPPFAPGFQLGPLSIRWYGILIVVAIFIGALIASRYVARRGQESDSVWSLLLWVVIPAIIGARLYYVFLQAPRGPNGLGNYLAHPLEILEIWQGGIHMYGGLLGGGIALLFYLYVKKLPAPIYLDAVGLALLPAQAIGRLGDFMNQGVYGSPTTLPWGLRIDPAYRIAPFNNLSLYPTSIRFQPLFLYEIILNLIGFVIIFWLARRFEKRLRAGDIVLMYLIWYPSVRFFLEFFRVDSWLLPGTPFTFVHIFSAIAIVGSIILLIVRHRKRLAYFPVGTLVKKRAWTEPEGEKEEAEEEEAMGGIEISEEYTFMRRSEQATREDRLENPEESEEDELMEEESEGIEDIEIWNGEMPGREAVEEGEEYLEEEYILEEPEKPEEPSKEEGKKEEEEETSEEEEETEEEETEEETDEEEVAGEKEEESGEKADEEEVDEDETGEEEGNAASEEEEESEESEDDEEGGDDEEGEDDGDAGDSSDE